MLNLRTAVEHHQIHTIIKSETLTPLPMKTCALRRAVFNSFTHDTPPFVITYTFFNPSDTFRTSVTLSTICSTVGKQCFRYSAVFSRVVTPQPPPEGRLNLSIN